MSNLIIIKFDSDNAVRTTMANLPLTKDVALILVPTTKAASKSVDQLEKALIEELAIIGAVKIENVAIDKHVLMGLLLITSDEGSPNENAEKNALAFKDIIPTEGFVLPIIPVDARLSLTKLVPKVVHKYNAALWGRSLREVIPAVFRHTGLSQSQPAVFISYKQSDTSQLAIQIFDALSHAGFDVFLDKFRIPPGVDFQVALTQELGEKSMLLVLESKTLSKSKWVKHEISVAKACGLGVMGLHLENCPTEPSIDLRVQLKATDQECDSKRIKEEELPVIIAEIIAQIDRTNVMRRQTLEKSLDSSANAFGCRAVPGPAGSFILKKGSKKRQIWLTSRPPNTPDFYKAHSYSDTTPISIIGLTRLWRLERANLADWLSRLSRMSLIDIDDLVRHVSDFANGNL